MITVKGYVTEEGEIRLEHPLEIPPGEVELIIRELKPSQEDNNEAEAVPTWTDEELDELLRPNPHPLTGAEIVAAGLVGGWEHKGITDGQAWVEEVKRKRKERRK